MALNDAAGSLTAAPLSVAAVPSRPPVSIEEPARLAALRSYAILDTPAEPAFDRVTQLAALMFDVPVAVISLVDESRQWFKSCHGLDACETPIEVSFCAHAILADDVMVVADATQDPRFVANPLVTGEPCIRFYAGAPLRTAAGHRLGTLCIIDDKPRAGFTDKEREILAGLAGIVMDEIELRGRFGVVVASQTRECEGMAAHLEGLLQACPLAIVTMTSGGIVTGSNSAADELFGWTRGEVIGQEVPFLDARAEHDPQRSARDRILRREPLPPVEFERERGEGRRMDLRVAATPLSDAAGGVIGMLAIMADITEQKRAERALIKAKEAAEAANQAKSEFLANMSHELRTPLNAIIGFAELMHRETFGPIGSPKYADYAGDIASAGNHLLEIINMILDLSRIDAGSLSFEESVFDIGSAIDGCVRLITARQDAAGLTLAVSLPEQPVVLRADVTRFRQMLLNLLSNALKFTPAPGKITISAEVASCGRFDLTVRDTGIGVRPEDVEKCLTAFGQIADAHSRAHDGIGLGLPLTKKLIELHGGGLKMRSGLGQGTSVVLQFPRERVVV